MAHTLRKQQTKGGNLLFCPCLFGRLKLICSLFLGYLSQKHDCEKRSVFRSVNPEAKKPKSSLGHPGAWVRGHQGPEPLARPCDPDTEASPP